MTRRPLLRAAALSALALLMGACTVLRTPYVEPTVVQPAQWRHAQPPAPIPGDAWWDRFGDPQLNRLVARVLARNNDLAVAAITLRRARLQARDAVINPTISATVTTASNASLQGPAISSRAQTADLLASYEVDLFGALAAQKDVAKWEARATAQDLESTRLSLIATTVDDYFQVGFLNDRIAQAERSVAYAQKALDLVDIQARAGAASSLEVAEAVRNLSTQQAGLHDLIEQRVEARSALDLLLNGEAAAPADELLRLPQGAMPPVDAGLPASLLARRPDLRATELRLREKLAQVDQARLSFYPVFSLTGAAGGTSTSLGDLLRHPVGTFGVDLALPFLQVDQVRLAVGVSRANYDIAAVQFRQTLYQALTDVENALSAREQLAAQGEAQARSLTNARTVERLDEVRYRAGSIPLQIWLDAQEARRQDENALEQTRLNRIENYVTLCKALGGDAALPR
ncbi:MAG TPA: efflux transporter outer membrane subunit [Phenylobacterium sp.]|jgi:NodT family efflux transporter outer membrane factor (OMF) lipoprotein|uniref:efflux transporter outer membrane subunit n=1 Tax=Phenylobacterium sp. TaxID=1871053 RepID=UPI002D5519F6|nr:efflux transporter outer membrane subunit [Phenylobacterium sp.]HZZ67096.1 efflux transporter outer membrane subunit [Phenylobacterium sp.]